MIYKPFKEVQVRYEILGFPLLLSGTHASREIYLGIMKGREKY